MSPHNTSKEEPKNPKRTNNPKPPKKTKKRGQKLLKTINETHTHTPLTRIELTKLHKLKNLLKHTPNN
jgi:hypothetical protein